MNLRSVFTFLNTGRYAFLLYVVNHQGATLQRFYHADTAFLYDIFSHHRATMQRRWRSLRSLSALLYIVLYVLRRNYSLKTAYPYMLPRHWSRRSFRVAWTTVTRYFTVLTTGYFAACSRCRTPQHACMATGVGRRDHITPVLRRLHWLPVRQRVVFKVAGLVHQSLDGVSPAYLIDDCRLLSDADRHPLRSSSSDIRTLVVPRTHNRFGDRSFPAASPRVWNDLPPGLRQPGLSLATFRRQLNY